MKDKLKQMTERIQKEYRALAGDVKQKMPKAKIQERICAEIDTRIKSLKLQKAIS